MGEYIRVTPEESFYGKKALLEAQLGILKATKHEEAYKKLRKEECMLKIALKKNAEEVLSSLHLLESLLPKTAIKEDRHLMQPHIKHQGSIRREKVSALDAEIESIRQKLAALR